MGKSEKRLAKRTTRFGYRAMDRALANIHALIGVFEPTHPEHATLLKSVAMTQAMAQSQLADFYRLTWGSAPGNWYSDP